MEEKIIQDSPEEFIADAGAMATLAKEQTAIVSYVPKSEAPYTMKTLIPRNMAFEVQKALNRIVKEKGNIDHYVRDGLKYISTATLWKSLAAEQVDGLGLYLKQFERGQGIIIADQTGIGKGRQAAGVIRHAVKNGYLPVFFTKSPNLFSDMYRDLTAIGLADIKPFIVNNDTKAKIKDADGNVVFTPLSATDQMELLTYSETYATESAESLAWHKKNKRSLPDPVTTPTVTITYGIDHLPTPYDMIFTTYSQVQAAHPYKRDWLAQLCKAGMEGSKKFKEVVFILDESHLAGGFESIIGTWMRTVLPHTRACCFLSATFAKYPEVMPFYGKKTAILEANKSDENLVSAMTQGGLALQEIVASNLAESGQLIRRQRSNKGIAIQYLTLDQEPQRSLHRQRVDRIITLMNAVVRFEKQYLDPILSGIHADAKRADESVKQKPKGLGVKQAPYFSRVFTIIDQMLFALKVEDVARKTIELLKQDKKVVIGFKSTMGAFLKDLNLASGDIIEASELDFVRTLLKGLDSVFNYSHTDIYGEKTRRRVLLEELPQSGIDEYNRIKEAMLSERSGLSITPIDQLIHLIQKEKKPFALGGHTDRHFKVAEITGRNQKVYFEEEEAIISSFRSDAEKSFREFNSGEYDVLLINQSGSTGASAHSSKDFKDRRQRMMIIHQFDLDINIVMQILGRVNRTGQVNLPGYIFMITDIPMEVRLLTMLKAKLKSLDANSTGSQKTSDDTFQSADFLNKYGDVVAFEWVSENKDMMEQLGYPTYYKTLDKETGQMVYERNPTKEGAIRQLTGRAGLLQVADQERLYNELLERYEHQIIIEKQQGTYDLETEFLPLDAEVKKRFLLRKGTGGTTPFGKDTVREVTIVNNLKRPFTQNEIEKRLLDILEGKDAAFLQESMRLQIEKEYPKLIESRAQKRMVTIDQLTQELEGLPKKGSAKDPVVNQKIEKDHRAIEEALIQKKNALDTYLQELEAIKVTILRFVGYWRIGDVVKVPLFGSLSEASWGIFLAVRVGKNAQNPYTPSNITFTFAVADSRKTLSFNLTPSEKDFISSIYAESSDITEEEKTMVRRDWNDIIKKASAKRENRQILTENILAVSDQIGTTSKLIKYNTKKGTIKNGILMSRSYGKEGDHKALMPISEGLERLESLAPDTLLKDHQLGITFKRIGQQYLQVYLKKKQHYKLALDPKLRRLIRKQERQPEEELADFVQNAGDMTGALLLRNAAAFLNVLDTYGIQIEGEAKELEDWELENKEDWNSRTHKSTLEFSYKLGRPYGQGSNPGAGFLNYTEADRSHPYGKVTYNRKLSDKEKYNYSLIPIFKNIEVPYLEWKNSIRNTALADDFKKGIQEAKTAPVYKAINILGYFITNHPHEDGNIEFVFGDYTPQELGKTCYEDMIGIIDPLAIVIDKLNLYFELLAA